MKNKKIMTAMIVIILILLVTIIVGTVLNMAGIDFLKLVNNKNNIEEIANNEKTENMANIQINAEQNSDLTEQNTNNEENGNVNIQEIRAAAVMQNDNEVINEISSRSQVARQIIPEPETLYIDTDENSAKNTDEYEELKQYIKLEDVKISFNMDVSKTTGLSKSDFITLVQNMKYDRTKILAKNAGWIWECCQKYNVNEIFVLGVCGIESAWCSAPQHQRTHNYSSLMNKGKLIPYASDEAGFEAMIQLLGQRYLTPGASFYHGSTITGVGTCYCNPNSWPKKVYTCMQQVFQ